MNHSYYFWLTHDVKYSEADRGEKFEQMRPFPDLEMNS